LWSTRDRHRIVRSPGFVPKSGRAYVVLVEVAGVAAFGLAARRRHACYRSTAGNLPRLFDVCIKLNGPCIKALDILAAHARNKGATRFQRSARRQQRSSVQWPRHPRCSGGPSQSTFHAVRGRITRVSPARYAARPAGNCCAFLQARSLVCRDGAPLQGRHRNSKRGGSWANNVQPQRRRGAESTARYTDSPTARAASLACRSSRRAPSGSRNVDLSRPYAVDGSARQPTPLRPRSHCWCHRPQLRCRTKSPADPGLPGGRGARPVAAVVAGTSAANQAPALSRNRASPRLPTSRNARGS